MNLYRKHRPKTFEDMIGNDSSIASLKKLIEKKKVNSFLFTGPKGCGKTSAARICAKELGTSEPFSLVEINCADNRGIDAAREGIIERMKGIPMDGSRYLVFIIDEVHRATPDWQGAMLKHLEDTPEYVYFFLCTTDPQKLLDTIRSRCTKIKFTPFSYDNLLFLLKRVRKAEKLNVGKEVLIDIAENCDSSARNALVLLEQVSEVEEEKEQFAIIKGYTEEVEAVVKELCQALLKGYQWKDVAKIIKNMEISDAEKIRYAVMGYMGAVLLNGKGNPRAAIALENFSEPFYNSGKNGIILASYQTLFE